MSTRLCIARLTLAPFTLVLCALVALTAPGLAPCPTRAAIKESICPKCGFKAPAFLAGEKCYHCGAELAAAPAAVSLDLHQPPPWFTARLPTGEFTLHPPAGHEKVEREVAIPADGLAPASTARASAAESIPLPNGPYTAIGVIAEHRGAADAPAAYLYIEVKSADGVWWPGLMKIAPSAATASGATTSAVGRPTLRVFWPPQPFTELRLSALDLTGTFTQGEAIIRTVQVQP